MNVRCKFCLKGIRDPGGKQKNPITNEFDVRKTPPQLARLGYPKVISYVLTFIHQQSDASK